MDRGLGRDLDVNHQYDHPKPCQAHYRTCEVAWIIFRQFIVGSSGLGRRTGDFSMDYQEEAGCVKCILPFNWEVGFVGEPP